METKPVKKQRNVAIELWRLIVALAAIGFHAGFIIARSCNEATGYFMETSNWFFGSSEVLLVFTVTAGYFMAAHFVKRKSDAAYMARSASERAWEYTWARIKTLVRCSSSAMCWPSWCAPASTTPTTPCTTSS